MPQTKCHSDARKPIDLCAPAHSREYRMTIGRGVLRHGLVPVQLDPRFTKRPQGPAQGPPLLWEAFRAPGGRLSSREARLGQFTKRACLAPRGKGLGDLHYITDSPLSSGASPATESHLARRLANWKARQGRRSHQAGHAGSAWDRTQRDNSIHGALPMTSPV